MSPDDVIVAAHELRDRLVPIYAECAQLEHDVQLGERAKLRLQTLEQSERAALAKSVGIGSLTLKAVRLAKSGDFRALRALEVICGCKPGKLFPHLELGASP